MAIQFQDARQLWEARLRGVSFARTATLAHLNLDLRQSDVRWLQRAYRAAHGGEVATPLDGYRSGDFADAFFRGFLGAEVCTTIDNSDYEGAAIVHDMNTPITREHWNRYDAVIDAGSLEHIFQFPIALGNLMRITKVGGRLFITTPANNLCGHGFYQFSPELMFRALSEENGFKIDSLLVFQSRFPDVLIAPYRARYRVVDPARVGQRVGLMTKIPTMMIVEAVKTEDVEPFVDPPQQSDYVAAWQNAASGRSTRGQYRTRGSVWQWARALVFDHMPEFATRIQKRRAGYRFQREYSLRNRHHFTELKE